MKWSVLLLLMFVVFGYSTAHARNYYRFKDETGHLVIRDSLPPKYVKQGYDIIRADGALVKRVPPELTPEEIEALKSKEQLKQQQMDREQADKRLLTIFSGPEDAERARDRKIEALNVLISVNKGNIARLQAEYDKTQNQAAEKERNGQEVPKHFIDHMESLTKQIKKLEEDIATKEQEKIEVRAEYGRDIERLRQLTGK